MNTGGNAASSGQVGTNLVCSQPIAHYKVLCGLLHTRRKAHTVLVMIVQGPACLFSLRRACAVSAPQESFHAQLSSCCDGRAPSWLARSCLCWSTLACTST